MMRYTHLEHEFVEQLPEHLQAGVLYISMKYAIASHQCCCGCGEEVVTPFTPTDWKLIFDGETVSLHPSIGNWSFTCRSHYFIRNGQVIEAATWDEKQIDDNRQKDKVVKASYYSKLEPTDIVKPTPDITPQTRKPKFDLRIWIVSKKNNFVQKVVSWFKQKRL
jgi:hypothetical protein